MNYYEKHIGDYIRDTVSLSMIEDGAYGRLLDQLYQTERPLPLDKKELYKLARANKPAEKKAVDYVISKFFSQMSDGYMQKRAQSILESFWDREPAEEQKKESAKIRQQRSRERRKLLFDTLREHGITPAFNASMRTLEAELSRVTAGDGSQNSNAPVTRDDTLTQTPIPNTQYPIEQNNDNNGATNPDQAPPAGVSLPPDPDEDQHPRQGKMPMREAPPLSDDPAIQLTVGLRRLGVNAPFTHPAVQDWATRSVTLELLTEAVAAARLSKPTGNIHPNYLVPIVTSLLNPPPAAAPAARPAREDWTWRKTDQGCNTEGAKYGLRARGGESRDSFIARIDAEKLKRKGQAA